jgi:hypothetical protein
MTISLIVRAICRLTRSNCAALREGNAFCFVGDDSGRRLLLWNVFLWHMVGTVIINSLYHVVLISFIFIPKNQVNKYTANALFIRQQ